ncbi:MAG: discoidin domain-containing protein [Capsulimonadaceae bacterium]|nr:discoidin domain-containing protein [Capsulimonadaceae bacterium]
MRHEKYWLVVLGIVTWAMISSVIASAAPGQSAAKKPRPLVGAIRWDAWVGDTNPGVGLPVEKALGPHQFHDRIPFFGKETGPDSVEARELTQDVMDQEIRYAHDAGIDYWAFDWYNDESGLAIARRLYLSSSIKSLVKYCFVMQDTYPSNLFPAMVEKYFKDPDYLKVLDNRPVFYLFSDKYTPEDFASLARLSRAAGLGDPYVIKCETGKGGGHTAGAAFDGDMGSYWQAATGAYSGEWLQVDFGANTTFDKAVLAELDGHTSAYEIRVWDGSQWQVAFAGTTIATRKAPTSVTFAPVTGTRARLCFLSGTQQPEICEFQIYNSAAGSANLALDKKASASSTGFHYDAISHYVTGAIGGAPFTAVMSNSEERWNRDKMFGLDVVPNVTAGADPRPRLVNPVPWARYYADHWAQEPTPGEVGAHVKQAMDWIDANPGADPSRLVLIYAWNEFDEGGWICPTLLHGSDRLDAIHKVLEAYGK